MSMTVSITTRPKLLSIKSAGDFTLEEAKRTFKDVIRVLDENFSAKVLFDGREVMGDPTVIERFYYSEFAARSVSLLEEENDLISGPQFAYVLYEPVLDPLRFGELVALNRGMHVKAFDNLDDAVEWLGLTLDDL